MPIPKDEKLYKKIKNIADTVYSKSSAYKSGFLVSHYVKEYKKKYGENESPYIDDGKEKKLKRWFEGEKWININPLLGKTGYPTYRPTIRINEATPKTVNEIPLKRLKEQYELKQKLKGNKNLPKF